jgi:hypothetical protein
MKFNLSVLFVLACAPDLRVDHPFDGTPRTGPAVVAEIVGASTILHIDATSKEAWIYVDLDTGKELTLDDALATKEWDLAYKRFEIKMNGGSQGDGPVSVAVLKNITWESLAKAPATGFQQDSSTSVFATVEDGWYIYDFLAGGSKHSLDPRPLVYVVKSSKVSHYKLRMLTYYDSAGTAAALSLEYAPVLSP